MKMRMVTFEKQKGKKLYEQVYEKLQDDILQGYLKQGDQLPSIRQAVTLFKVSKTCVQRAYEVLEMKGLIKSIAQKGFFVDVDSKHVLLRKQVMEHVYDYEEEVIRYDFRSQSMDQGSFDIALWKKYLKEVLDRPQDITTYGEGQGEKALRIAFANYAYAMRGVLCSEQHILVGASFQSLLYIVLGLLMRPCVFGMEEDGFLPAQNVCEDYRIPIRYLPRDEEGICMDALYKSDVTVLYINSVACGLHHQPLRKKRQKELLDWAQQNNAYIIEDDHNGELRYFTRMTPAMQGMDGGQHVLYIGSFSRLLLPSLRISYVVLNEALWKQYQKRMEYYTPTSSKIEQLALAHYITDGHLERHVKKLRKHYKAKSTRMYTLLQSYFPNATMYLEEAALRYIVHIPLLHDVTPLIEQAKKRHIQIFNSDTKELVLSFAAIQQEDMEDAIQALFQIYQDGIS